MTCKDNTGDLEEYLDGKLEGERYTILVQHITTCVSCQAELQKRQKLRQALKEMPVPPLSPDFSRRVFMAAAQHGRKELHRRSFYTGFGSAIAAGLALWMVTAVWFQEEPPPAQPLPTVSIALDEVRKVKLVFTSARELHQAKVSIRLPDNVELAGFPGQRVVSWEADLDQGKNLLALPLRALQQQVGTLEAQIEHDGKIKILRINLAVEKSPITGSSERSLPLV